MMQVVVGGQVPQHRLTLSKDVVTKEQVVSFLTLRIKERIVVVSLETLHHVSRMAGPLVDLRYVAMVLTRCEPPY